MAEEARGPSAIELAQGIWGRRKWLAIFAFAVPFAASMSFIAFLPNLYKSTVTVIVDRQQVPEIFVRPTVNSPVEIRLQTVRQDMLNRQRVESVISRTRLYPDLVTAGRMDTAVERLRRDVDLKVVEQREGPGGGTVAFALNVRGREPAKVSQAANMLASLYIDDNLKTRERQAAGTTDFLKGELAGVKKRLDSQEQVLSDFKKRYLGELPTQLESNLSTIDRLNVQLRSNIDSQARTSERREALLKQLAEASAPEGGGGGIPVDAAEERLAKMNEELRQLRANYSDKYPDVVRLRGEIAALEREMSRRGTEPPKPAPKPAPTVQSPYVLRTKQALGEVDAELSILKNEEKRVRSALGEYLGRVQNVPKREQEFKELSRDYETTRELYASMLKRYEEAQLAESMEQRRKGEQFKILEAAGTPKDPAAPDRLRLAVVGLALSVGLAVAAVVAAEQLNATFHSLDELRAFTVVPVLIGIPRIVTSADIRRRQRRTQLATLVSVASLVVIVGACYAVAHDNESMVSLLLSKSS